MFATPFPISTFFGTKVKYVQAPAASHGHHDFHIIKSGDQYSSNFTWTYQHQLWVNSTFIIHSHFSLRAHHRLALLSVSYLHYFLSHNSTTYNMSIPGIYFFVSVSSLNNRWLSFDNLINDYQMPVSDIFDYFIIFIYVHICIYTYTILLM